MSERPKVAIACQGGGSHAAFAAGVLGRLLSEPYRDRFELVALSGTSGGAICAALAWAGMIDGGPDDAVRRLSEFWRDLQVHDLFGAVLNFWALTFARLPVTQEFSPYTYEPLAAPLLHDLLFRHLDLDGLPADPDRRSRPCLLVGATEILSGERTIFRDTALTYDMLIASAAVPPLYRAVPIAGGLYWDGLFTSNPPIRELTGLPRPPDEIWVIRINPQARAEEPRTIRDIDDRRNELGGNLSLAQELFFIQRINELRREHESLARKYRHIQIRVVELGVPGLDHPSKLDRSPQFVEQLLANGAERAAWFFEDRSLWPENETLPTGSVSYG